MLLALKRANVCVCFSLSVCSVVAVVLMVYFLNTQLVLTTGKIDIETSHRRTFSKDVVSKSSSEKKQSNMLSPHINPVFHIDMSRTNLLILFWDAPDWFKRWTYFAGTNQCRHYTNCEHSFDLSLLNVSQAVVFNLPHRGINNKPPVNFRKPNQAWVFFTLESPLHLNSIYRSAEWHNMFNWSWSYHPNADIFHPYGVLVKKQHLQHRNYSTIFRKKTKTAAWLVSNCNAPSRRNDYVTILKRYIDVDVFGRCGQEAPENIESVISEQYKFYLGFENSLCENYMTEKVFRYYKYDVITVLRGNTKYQDYLPSGSFIDTANFSSIAALAQYMKDLGENEEKYVSFLKVKDKFTVYEREFLYKDALCNLCEKINNMDQNRRTYDDIFKWLGQCHNARDLTENSTFDISENVGIH
ncbi:4-galactosyl-N-acetylglucosaminide 3-alpha-L-fucosyltransferase 9-like isoform X2 [Mercenaria mercenaria]|nr:4-galactosyl-N-acetylglucosaminide 3-alpha-L-fucosyltransferase 9-like isoform X2 [Mercenaria mercenaria]XP_045216145.2 4-galactosyl-N-acetylglucosaminide 3-alpha-L-fucosyltransferase 9-like isoform X2 [Mercenaria mercenaria]XP_045216146.2 4-galactosyl-N-acetylglucosaminide 3-alpha-L-fucosyltransferase 9-like isoform X2 [Mercenaria mercenaria]XP_045216147.2 4-galactosyl-N-acetylglucosaminide 3-alpha-L-fucosyltransferase 9-like isoform X2 [Mercenaria mercenaria]XP_045216148.2 4-galactosyl-N-a